MFNFFTGAAERAELDGRSEGAIFQKCKRMGLRVVVKKNLQKFSTTSELELPKELPSVEEALKILGGAIKQKLRRIGVLVVVQNPQRHTTRSVPLAGLGLKVVVRKRGKPRTTTSKLVPQGYFNA